MIAHLYYADVRPDVMTEIIAICGAETWFKPFPLLLPHAVHLCVHCRTRRDVNPPGDMQLFAVVDRNFICGGCTGFMVEVRREPNGKRVFNCENCKENECLECAVCHYPRAIWADDGTVCDLCALDMMQGRRELTAEQKAGIEKWKVIVYPPKPPNPSVN